MTKWAIKFILETVFWRVRISREAGPRYAGVAKKSDGMYKVYILKSLKFGKYYTGHTKDLNDRILRHNTGRSVYSKKFAPWKLIYTEIYNTKSEAYRRELEIKSYKGGIKFKKLIGEFK